jgi:hypothetical protein
MRRGRQSDGAGATHWNRRPWDAAVDQRSSVSHRVPDAQPVQRIGLTISRIALGDSSASANSASAHAMAEAE